QARRKPPIASWINQNDEVILGAVPLREPHSPMLVSRRVARVRPAAGRAPSNLGSLPSHPSNRYLFTCHELLQSTAGLTRRDRPGAARARTARRPRTGFHLRWEISPGARLRTSSAAGRRPAS